MPRRSLLLPVLLLAACTVREYVPQPPFRPARRLSAEERARFDYALVRSATLTDGWCDRDAVVSRGELTIQLSGDSEPTRVEFEYWRSDRAEPGRAPALVVTPILGGGEELALSQCRGLVAAGFHAALVQRGTRVMSASWQIATVEQHFRRAVAARRAVLDWLAAQPEVDPERLGAFGISMGGILTAVLTAADPRIHSAVVALGGADLAHVIRVSSEGRLVRFRDARAAERQGDLDAVERELRAALLSDPGRMATAVDPRRVLQVAATLDTVVPYESQLLLWERLGRPRRYDLPTGHYTGIFYLPYVMQVATRWLQSRFATPAPVNLDGSAAGPPGRGRG